MARRPHYSPDNKWWWNGSRWVPTGQSRPSGQPPPPPGPGGVQHTGFWGTVNRSPLWLKIAVPLVALLLIGIVIGVDEGTQSSNSNSGPVAGATATPTAAPTPAATATPPPRPPAGYDFYAEAVKWAPGSHNVTVKVFNVTDTPCDHTLIWVDGYDKHDKEVLDGLSDDVGHLAAGATEEFHLRTYEAVPSSTSRLEARSRCRAAIG